jgi:hypothetical protein
MVPFLAFPKKVAHRATFLGKAGSISIFLEKKDVRYRPAGGGVTCRINDRVTPVSEKVLSS